MQTKFACLKDFEEHCQRYMAPPTFQHIKGPENTDSNDYRSIQVKLRGLANMALYTDPLSTTILGQKVSSPIGFGAFPNQSLSHVSGEKASAAAASSMGQFYVLSSFSSFCLEEIAMTSTGPMMFELDMRLPERVRNELISRVLRFP